MRGFLLLPLSFALAGTAHADDGPSPAQPGAFGAGLHLQLGLGLGETFAGEPIQPQVHPRLSLRYDSSASQAWRLTGRHQRRSGDGSGHAELTLTPTALRRWRVGDSLRGMLGAGLSIGAFTKFIPKGPDAETAESEYAIPVSAEFSATLSWQWKPSLSLEATADYRPIVFADGSIEHALTQSVSLSLDL